MKLQEAITEVRRKLGIITTSKDDTTWLCNKIVSENKEVFDKLR